MQQRKIAADEIVDVLHHAHTRYTDPRGSEDLIGHPNGRRIKVVIAQGSTPPFIIAVADSERQMPLSIEYDRQADALYARLSDRDYAFGEDHDHARRVD